MQARGCAEVAIHVTYDVDNDEELEAVLIVDAENACSSVNINVMLHNISDVSDKLQQNKSLTAN